jgi:hypothetical protein
MAGGGNCVAFAPVLPRFFISGLGWARLGWAGMG